MAITKTVYQLRPPEVTAVLWDKASDGPEIATWCGGRLLTGGVTMQIPNVVDDNEGYIAVLPCYIMQVGRRFMPLPVADFEAAYSKKIV